MQYANGKNDIFCLYQMTASLSHCVVYTLLLSALTAFDENTLTRNTEEMQVGMLTALIIFENTPP